MPDESTTPDLVELTRRAEEVAERGDWDAVMRFAADAVWDMSRSDMGIFERRTAIRDFFEDWFGAYEEFGFELEENVDLGNGVGFRVRTQRGRPVGSTGEVRMRSAEVAMWVDGMIDWVTTYLDIDEARAAAERLAEERG